MSEVICKGCKWRRFDPFSWLLRRDGKRLYEKCVNPKVLKQQQMKKGFCTVALMWPCTDGCLKEEK